MMIGRTLSHYTILEKLGAGGMGEVYVAEDTKLSRKVALKVLPPEIAENAERRARFEQEAKAVAAPEEKSIAVLPFDNLSDDPEQEYFSNGLTEDVITKLSKIPGLLVISRTSSMRYKHTEKTLREIGEELGVATVLEGPARKQGDRVRITAQLIDDQTDRHLWAESYDRQLSDIFAI
jgi:adenylate cyclase